MDNVADTVALNYGVYIHKNWHEPSLVSEAYRTLKVECLNKHWDYSLVLKRVGDYARECFDREPKTRDVPLEEATANLQKFVDYWKQEM